MLTRCHSTPMIQTGYFLVTSIVLHVCSRGRPSGVRRRKISMTKSTMFFGQASTMWLMALRRRQFRREKRKKHGTVRLLMLSPKPRKTRGLNSCANNRQRKTRQQQKPPWQDKRQKGAGKKQWKFRANVLFPCNKSSVCAVFSLPYCQALLISVDLFLSNPHTRNAL